MDAMTLTTTAFAEGQERAPLVKVIHVVILQWMLLWIGVSQGVRVVFFHQDRLRVLIQVNVKRRGFKKIVFHRQITFLSFFIYDTFRSLIKWFNKKGPRYRGTLKDYLSEYTAVRVTFYSVDTFPMSFLLRVSIFLETTARAAEIPSSVSPPTIENILNADSVLNCTSLSIP